MTPPDWKDARARLTRAAADALTAFATEHVNVECSHLVFDSEPRYGYVQLSLDSTANSVRTAQAREKFAIEQRQQMLSGEDPWREAEYFLNHPVLTPFGDNAGSFEFQSYRELEFPEWQEYAESADYPAQEENENDYLEGNFRILVWHVVEELVSSGAFDCLNKAKPFLVSYGLHDQEQSIIRILDWPAITND